MAPQGMAPQGMQYYPVVAPQGMQYYPVQAHQMQQLQMYTPSQQVGVGVQPSNTNMFFKTRLCNKWRSGMCPFGDKCTYAHGQHEMRQLDPQVLMQQQMYAGGMPAGMQGGMPAGMQGGMPAGMQGGMHGHHGDKGRYGRRGEGEKTQLYYKTRWVLVSTDCIVGKRAPQAPRRPDGQTARRSSRLSLALRASFVLAFVRQVVYTVHAERVLHEGKRVHVCARIRRPEADGEERRGG